MATFGGMDDKLIGGLLGVAGILVGLILGPWSERGKARALAKSAILVDYNANRIRACRELFEAAGAMCSPVYDPGGEILTRPAFARFLNDLSSALDRNGVFLDPCSRACAIVLREIGGDIYRKNIRLTWDDSRELWVAKSLLRSVLNRATHLDVLDPAKLQREAWITTEMRISSFKSDLLANLELLDEKRGDTRDSKEQNALVEAVLARVARYVAPKKARPFARPQGDTAPRAPIAKDSLEGSVPKSR